MNSVSCVSFNQNEQTSTVKPKITVGFCVRNCEASIEEAFNSILAQDYSHKFMELIFVDDGSEDNTNSIVCQLASTTSVPLRVYHTVWGGIGHARNIVLANAKGQYIVWVDGDMVLSTDYIAKLVELMDSNPDLGIAKGKQSLEQVGNKIAVLETYARAASRMVDYRSERARLKSLGTGGSIYRIEALSQAGYFDENLRGYGEDQDIEIRIRKLGWKLATVNAVFQDYERFGLTLRSLNKRYYNRGYCTHYFLHKNPDAVKLYNMLPHAIFIAALFQSQKLFKITNSRTVFLLPFHNVLKMFAWYLGFVNSHYNSYAPEPN